jgi:hypothetical protein
LTRRHQRRLFGRNYIVTADISSRPFSDRFQIAETDQAIAAALHGAPVNAEHLRQIGLLSTDGSGFAVGGGKQQPEQSEILIRQAEVSRCPIGARQFPASELLDVHPPSPLWDALLAGRLLDGFPFHALDLGMGHNWLLADLDRPNLPQLDGGANFGFRYAEGVSGCRDRAPDPVGTASALPLHVSHDRLQWRNSRYQYFTLLYISFVY